MATEIVQKDNSVLRKTAEPVSQDKIGSAKLAQVITEMKDALASQDDGVALAAPQIGVPLRIFIVSGKTIAILKHGDLDEKDLPHYPDEVYINPRIIKLSKEKEEMEEGCLSVRWSYGFVKRAKKATVQAVDENGKKITRGASGLLAQIFQHEIDHLDGILFIDKAERIREAPPEQET